MNLEQYIKLRCDLNNKDYKEVNDTWDSGNNTFKAEKFILNENNVVKYVIKYTVIDYGENTSNQYHQYNATVSATFFIERKDIAEEMKKYTTQKYDTFSMYYHLVHYQEPNNIEKIFEDTWNKLNIFVNNPYSKAPK